MALRSAEIEYQHREISFKNKPQHMLEISPKGTVPVLQLSDGSVLEESLDIMHWALAQNDPESLMGFPDATLAEIESLVSQNDQEFKLALDRYKYPERFGEQSGEHWRQQGEQFLLQLETLLGKHRLLFADRPSLADLAIFPFVRQFAHVDTDWFDTKPYPKLSKWYQHWISSELFTSIMEKHPLWEE